ncbi:hypothetical protein KC901_02635 [Patescibacteria group bacterium]|nr:hypothetical protein [Patescibacteria group bacterium]
MKTLFILLIAFTLASCTFFKEEESSDEIFYSSIKNPDKYEVNFIFYGIDSLNREMYKFFDYYGRPTYEVFFKEEPIVRITRDDTISQTVGMFRSTADQKWSYVKDPSLRKSDIRLRIRDQENW